MSILEVIWWFFNPYAVLRILELYGDKYVVSSMPLLLSPLPQGIRLEWSREGKESDWQFLFEFLKGEIQRRKRSQMLKETISPVSSQTVLDEAKRTKMTTASAVQLTASCVICNKAHMAGRFKLMRAPVFWSEREIMYRWIVLSLYEGWSHCQEVFDNVSKLQRETPHFAM